MNPGLYIHIPYCLKKCDYCAFSSRPGYGVPQPYLSSLTKEIKWGSGLFGLKVRPVDTLYFGGGTPSLLAPDELGSLIQAISCVFNLTDDAEITLELNPSTADLRKLSAFREAGINRLSIGVQSFQPCNLNFLGRLHSADEALRCVRNANVAGFENISLDLIYGLPGQTRNDLLTDLHKAVGLNPRHISLYLLTLEKNTPLYQRAEKGRFLPLRDDLQEELFHEATAILSGTDYIRYETSNYAKKGYESRHNLKYWKGADYLGFGAAAHSYLNDVGWGMRWWNVSHARGYIKAVKAGKMPVDNLEILSRGSAVIETVFTSLRTREGLREETLLERFEIGLHDAVSLGALRHIPKDLFILEKGRLSLTDKGALLADEIAGMITTQQSLFNC